MSATSVELSVVIPLLDGAATIEGQLHALRDQVWSGSWEVIVADNGSQDDGPSIVRRIAAADPRVHLVDASSVRGPSAARNAGVRAARGTSLAFCDADDEVGTGWVEAVGEGLRRHDAVTGPQAQDRLNPPWLAGVHGRSMEEELQTFEGCFPFGPSANLAVRRSVFDGVGGFDPELTVGEDLDLCLRLWHGGHELTFLPDATVHYRNRSTLRALFDQAVSYGAAGPMIVGRMRPLGHAVPSRVRGLRRWAWLVRNVGMLRSTPGRARWVVVAGQCIGRCLGSVQQRQVLL